MTKVMHFVSDAVPAGTAFGRKRGRRLVEVAVPRRTRRRRRRKAPVSDDSGRFVARVRAVLETCLPDVRTSVRTYEGSDCPADGGAVVEATALNPGEARTTAVVMARTLRRFGLEADVRVDGARVHAVVIGASDHYDPWHKRIVERRPFA